MKINAGGGGGGEGTQQQQKQSVGKQQSNEWNWWCATQNSVAPIHSVGRIVEGRANYSNVPFCALAGSLGWLLHREIVFFLSSLLANQPKRAQPPTSQPPFSEGIKKARMAKKNGFCKKENWE